MNKERLIIEKHKRIFFTQLRKYNIAQTEDYCIKRIDRFDLIQTV